MMEREDLVYLAGFYHGEGWARVKEEKHGPPTANISLSQNDKTYLEWVQSHFGGIIQLHREKAGGRNHELIINQAADVVRLGELIFPFLRDEKRKRILTIVVAVAKLVGKRGANAFTTKDKDALLRFKLLELYEREMQKENTMASVGREPEGTPKAIPGTVSNPVSNGNPNDPPIPGTISGPKKVGNVPISGTVSGPKGG